MLLKTISFLFMTCLTVLILWAFGWMWFATNIALSEPENSNSKTEAIIVLTGGNGRINAGLDLLAANAPSKLFISGVHQGTTEDDIYKSWKNPTTRQPCCVTLGYEAVDTLGNAAEVKKWVDDQGIKNFRLVTSSYHMPRAMHELSRVMDTENIIQHPVFSDDFEPWQGRFWSLTFSEYNKILIRWMGLGSLEEHSALPLKISP